MWYKLNLLQDSVRPKTPVARYYFKKFDDEGKPIKYNSFSLKPKKSKDPAPGSYDVVEAVVKTQWPKNMYAF